MMGYLKHKLIDQMIEECGCERNEPPPATESKAQSIGEFVQKCFERDLLAKADRIEHLMLYGDGTEEC